MPVSVELGFVALHPRGLAQPDRGLHQLAPRLGVGAVDLPGGVEEATAVLGGNLGQQAAVARDQFEEISGGAQPLGESCLSRPSVAAFSGVSMGQA